MASVSLRELMLLLDDQRNQALRIRLHEVTHQLGEGGASRRAAERILKFMVKHRE